MKQNAKTIISRLPGVRMAIHKDEAAWKVARILTVGASEAASAIGFSKRKGQYALWAEKSGLIQPADLSNNKAVRRGRRLEQAVADIYCEEEGAIVVDPGRYTSLTNDDYPGLSATLDRIVVGHAQYGCSPPGLLECKTLHIGLRHDIDEGPYLDHQIQVQAQLAVTGFFWGDLAYWCGDDWKVFHVKRDDTFIEAMQAEITEFWWRVGHNDPPTADGTAATWEALRQIHPNDLGKQVQLPPSLRAVDEEIAEAQKQRKFWTDRLEAGQAKIIQAIGDASGGYFAGGGPSYTYNKQARKEVVIPASTFRVLRRKEK